MKRKISISISSKTYQVVKSSVDGQVFRNSSHFIEYAISKLIEDDSETFKSSDKMLKRGVRWSEK